MPDRSIEYVQTGRSLAALLDDVHASDSVALDTEFIGEKYYEPSLCLVQVGTRSAIWIVDPLANLDLRPLWEAMTDPEREMLVFAAREEMRFCLRYAERVPERVVDLQVVAGMVGLGYPLSHTNAVRRVLGLELPHGEAYTDWQRRPLAGRQVEYAADDVRHLHALRDRLMESALRTGEDTGAARPQWIEAECRRAIRKVVEGEAEERWRRVSGGGGLSRRELAVLREIWRWRDARARDANRPPRRVMRDELMVEIARRKPVTQGDLLDLRGVEHSSVRAEAPRILEAVKTAMSLADRDLPPTGRRHDPPQVSTLASLLNIAVADIAARTRIDPALLATTADLQDLVRWRLGRGSGPEPLVLTGWRGELLRGPLMDVLDGKVGLRVTDIRSPSPLHFEDLPRRS